MGDASPRVTQQEVVRLSSAYLVGRGNAETGDTRSREMLHKREQMVMWTVVTARRLTPT